MRARAIPLAALLIASAAAPARAESDEERRDQIDQLLFDPPVGRARSRPARAERARLALAHLRVLLEKTPDDGELRWLAGRAWLAVSDELGADKAPAELVRRAIEQLERARRAAPEGAHAESTAVDLGILYSKLGQHERALAEYDRALRIHRASSPPSDDDDSAANLLGNSAETLMALGRLGEAIARYRAGAELAGSDPRTRVLANFGLAVALDRDEQIEKSREAMRQALSADPQMRMLDDQGVFFMPAGDKFYYLALGYLQQGEDTAAAAALRSFLHEQPTSRFAGRARAHLADLARGVRFFEPGGASTLTFGAIRPASRSSPLIERMLQRSELALTSCFPRENFVRGGTEASLILEVSTDARARLLELEGSAVPGRDTYACIERVVRGWLFLPRGKREQIALPLHLAAR